MKIKENFSLVIFKRRKIMISILVFNFGLSFTLQTIKPSLSKSTLNLLQAVKRRQTASLGGSFSEISSPCTPPSTPRDRRMGLVPNYYYCF